MKTEATDIFILKATAIAGGLGGVVGGFLTGGQPIPFFNVSVTTLGMAAAGSLLAFAYGTPILDRRKLYGFAVGGVFIGVWAIHILRWRGVEVPEEVAGPLAGSIALISRWALPAIVDTLPGLWRVIVTRVLGVNMEQKK